MRLPLLRKRSIDIDPTDIVFFASEGCICKCCFKDDLQDIKEIAINSTLASLLDQLPSNFFRIHRGFIVNLLYVLDYGLYPQEMIKLSKIEAQLPLSKHRKLDFHNAYLKLKRNK